LSIRVRLAMWYGTIFGVALLLFSVGLYVFMARHLDGMVDEAMARRANYLIATITTARQHMMMPADTFFVPPLDTFESPEVYVQVTAANGTVLARSANLGGRSLPVASSFLEQRNAVVYLDEAKLKLSTTPIAVDGKTVGWVQVASSLSQRDVVLARLRWVLMGGGVTAVVVVGFLSGALAGRAIQPVSEMTETARAIALSKGFNRRLPPVNANDELGRLAQTFNEMLASLEAAYAAQKRFTADASHELRAPLTSIRGNLDLLARIKQMPEEERVEVLNYARKEVERLSRLVNDLLALARADTGQPINLRPVEMDALLAEVHHQAQAMADGVSVRLTHLEPALVRGDEDRLKELLLILVDNAIRYTPHGGTVSLSLKCEHPEVIVSVEDTGIGIETEDLPHVFDRFWRADKARSRDSGGTGLGLSIAKDIVERHKGEITVRSVPGHGSRFDIHLPASG